MTFRYIHLEAMGYSLWYSLNTSVTYQWIRTDLNRRPPTCEAGALPTELRTRFHVYHTTFNSKIDIIMRESYH